MQKGLNVPGCSSAYSKTQPAITYSKLTIETPEQGMKYVQS